MSAVLFLNGGFRDSRTCDPGRQATFTGASPDLGLTVWTREANPCGCSQYHSLTVLIWPPQSGHSRRAGGLREQRDATSLPNLRAETRFATESVRWASFDFGMRSGNRAWLRAWIVHGARAALLLGKPAPGAVFLQVPNNRPAFKTTPRYTGTQPWGYAAARVTSTVT